MIKTAKILLLSGVCLPLMGNAASADPVSIGSFIISSFLSVGAGGLLPAVSAAAIGQFVLGAAVVGISVLSAITAKAPKLDPGEFKNTFETGESSEIRAIGRVRVGGLKAFGNTKGIDRYRLICHTKGLVTAVEQHYLGGREVTVESTGAVSSPPFGRTGGSWVFIKRKNGTGTETAWPELISTFPDLWTSAHRVRGIAQSLVQYISPGLTDDKFLELYQSGAPDYERVQRSEPIYDPRDPAQSPTNTATWLYRDNGILGAAHIMRSYPSLTAADFDYEGIALEATKADAIVVTKTGTEVRSRSWGVWTSESPRGEIMDQALRSIGAEIYQTVDNKVSMRLVDDVRVPDITIPAKHIVDLQWKSGPDSVERPNVCRVKYYSPERNYDMGEIDLTGIAWARIDDEIARVGEQFYDVELPFCPSAAQAQRIARRLFALARADAGVVKTNFMGLACWGKTVADIELPDLDVTETCAIGNPRVNDEEGTVEIPFIVWPTLTPWNPAVDEAYPPEQIPEMGYESDLETPAAPSAAEIIQFPNGVYDLRVAFTGVPDGDIAECVYRYYTGGEPNAFQGMAEYSIGSNQWRSYDAVPSAGLELDVKCRFFDNDGNGSYFSDVLHIANAVIDNTACAAPSVGGSFLSGGTATATELRVAAIRYQVGGGGWTTVNARPSQAVTFPVSGAPGSDVLVEAQSITSNGTLSPIGSTTIHIP